MRLTGKESELDAISVLAEGSVTAASSLIKAYVSSGKKIEFLHLVDYLELYGHKLRFVYADDCGNDPELFCLLVASCAKEKMEREKVTIGDDVIDPDEKRARIAAKAEYIKNGLGVLDIIRMEAEKIPPPNSNCPECKVRMEEIPHTQNNYACMKCGCSWEYVGTIREEPVWICLLDPKHLSS